MEGDIAHDTAMQDMTMVVQVTILVKCKSTRQRISIISTMAKKYIISAIDSVEIGTEQHQPYTA
jgi:ribosomal protein L31